MTVRLPTGSPRFFPLLLGLLAATLLSACSPRQLVMDRLADELAVQSGGDENDLELARDAAPYHLKLSETLLRQNPDHLGLAEAVTAGFTQYAYAFVAFDADRIEGQDVAAANRLRQRAARLYRRASDHALTALERAHPGFRQALNDPAQPPTLPPAQAGLGYWAAAAWAGAISLSKDDPDAVADLPLAVRLAEIAWQADPDWGQGSLTGLRATLEAARPGGSRTQALRWFDQAIAQGGTDNVGPLLGKAEGYALPAGDRPLFEQLLRQALAVHEPAGSPLTLSNEVMRRRARWLLDSADDLF